MELVKTVASFANLLNIKVSNLLSYHKLAKADNDTTSSCRWHGDTYARKLTQSIMSSKSQEALSGVKGNLHIDEAEVVPYFGLL